MLYKFVDNSGLKTDITLPVVLSFIPKSWGTPKQFSESKRLHFCCSNVCAIDNSEQTITLSFQHVRFPNLSNIHIVVDWLI